MTPPLFSGVPLPSFIGTQRILLSFPHESASIKTLRGREGRRLLWVDMKMTTTKTTTKIRRKSKNTTNWISTIDRGKFSESSERCADCRCSRHRRPIGCGPTQAGGGQSRLKRGHSPSSCQSSLGHGHAHISCSPFFSISFIRLVARNLKSSIISNFIERFVDFMIYDSASSSFYLTSVIRNICKFSCCGKNKREKIKRI